MQVDSHLDTNSLATLGVEAVRLLCAGNISTLAARFGYALAYDREPAAAITDDLRSLLVKLGATTLTAAPDELAATVKYFEPNSSCLLAVVTGYAHAQNGSKIQVELVMAGNESEKHVTLEQISSAA